ncbi:D-alanyl-D-alanine carboxypeptidase/D-alanyl-D-alanine-endopeptidase (penicillin-binding protein 4) [Aquabacterium commune]|uniref:D-alanyl-D-alanine carboxypeptidase/D-alanyl-D-alanine-endopeptidase (Penicillin-binding protein 4) n=2 Tax=Aquabacterium commune TaxID=70586 RepID=A0A4R6R6Z4_9BURK|nr:D-alanyl-D-alanine carboxypeptidase/D-alanyl-D-alanine-endopeptidase (penicillin-binding protein 4) [Aquabacterium commune]
MMAAMRAALPLPHPPLSPPPQATTRLAGARRVAVALGLGAATAVTAAGTGPGALAVTQAPQAPQAPQAQKASQAPQAPISPTPWPPTVAAALQASGLPAEAFSLLVWPVDGVAPRWQHLAASPRLMASVMKLFTTGAALRSLGPAYTWRTEAGLGGPLLPNGALDGPLYLRGGGDPSLVIERVQLMMSRWRGAGLRDIRGDLLTDRSAFELPPHDPAAFDGQVLKPYNAGPDALLLNHGAVTLRLLPDAAQPGQVRASLAPTLDGVELVNHLSPQPKLPCGDWREALNLTMAPVLGWHHLGRQRWRVTVQGPYPLSCGEREWPLLWRGDGPDDHGARLLSQAWQDGGGRLGGTVRNGTWPAGLPVWQTWTSPPLATVVRDINKFSNNVMARQLFLTLGAAPANRDASRDANEPPRPATLASARGATAQLVLEATRAGNRNGNGSGRGQPSACEGEALQLDNGAGLSRSERSTALCLGQWLQALWRSPVMPEFVASLPVNGTDGTTRRWQAAAGRAHIKTGSLDGVASMAGYVDAADGSTRVIVVGVVNHPRADAGRPVLQALTDWAQHLNTSDASAP